MTNNQHGQVPNKYLTVVYRDIAPGKEARELIEHPKMSASSWSHALNDRDAAIAQVSTLRTAHVQNPTEIEHDAGDVSKNGAGLNMSTQHARIAELEAQIEALSGVQALSAAPEAIAKLRHLYQNMVNGAVRDTASAKRIAEGLLAPAIEALERATPPAEQAAPKAAPGVGNSGFDHQTAADFLNGKTVSDEAVRKFVAASRWAHDERAYLSAMLLSVRGVLASREAEIALLKKALMEAEAAPQQDAQEPTEIPEEIERMAADRYKVVPSHESMFHRWAVVAGTGTQQLYLGREVECQNMARKFAGAFLDGAFVAMQSTSPNPAPAPLSEREAFERDWEKRHAPVPINGRTHDDGRYGDSSIQDAWESWQARAALAAQGGKDA